jgi:DNA-binding response OmpR family regulator
MAAIGVGNSSSSERIDTMKAKRKRILIADCHEDVLIILERLLEDAGFDTTTVWTAAAALKLIESRTFDLVLVNEHLPDAECEDVLKALRKRGVQTPCIVMQPGAPEIVDVTRFGALGATDIVPKNCFRRIVEIVRECLLCDREAIPAA